MAKFIKYFTKSLLNEAVPAPLPQDPALDDSTAFAGSFEDGNGVEQIAGEVANASIDPVQRDMILKKADKYAENISNVILPTIRKLHNDIVSGVFKSIAPDLKGVSSIAEDLASLSESLRGRIRDAVIKSDNAGKK